MDIDDDRFDEMSRKFEYRERDVLLEEADRFEIVSGADVGCNRPSRVRRASRYPGKGFAAFQTSSTRHRVSPNWRLQLRQHGLELFPRL